MAADDATTAAWVRTREQVDGSIFSQRRELQINDVDAFLLEYDPRPLSKRVLDVTLKAETTRLHELPARMMVAFSANRAQLYGWLPSLAAHPKFVHVAKQSRTSMELIHIADVEARLKRRIPPSREHRYQAPAVNTLGAASTSGTSTSGHKNLRKDEQLPTDLATVGRDYQKAGRKISTRLVDFVESKMGSWPEVEREQIKRLYTIETYSEHGTASKYPRMRSCSAFEKISRPARKLGWIMDDEVAGWFITAITGRRKLRNWYDHLPSNDSRFEANSRHEAWFQTLIEVVVALAGHQY